MKLTKWFALVVVTVAFGVFMSFGCSDSAKNGESPIVEPPIADGPSTSVPGDDVPSPEIGQPATQGDIDGDGAVDIENDDIDGDGTPNEEDDDMDGDGIPNDNDHDADGDGVAKADGDCDDLNPNIKPGAVDKPDFPNMVDSNCDGIDGDLKKAVWVSHSEGNDDGNDGSIKKPFKTIGKAVQVVETDASSVEKDIYVVGGKGQVYNESVTLKKCEDIYGGYSTLELSASEGVGKRTRSADSLNRSFIQGSANSQVPTVAIRSEGCDSKDSKSVVQGMNVLAVEGNPAIEVDSSTASVEHNSISGRPATDNPKDSFGVRIIGAVADNSVEVKNNEINVFSTKSNIAQTVGIYVISDVKMDVDIFSNTIKARNSEKESVAIKVWLPNGNIEIVKNYLLVGFVATEILDLPSNQAEESVGILLAKVGKADIYKNKIRVNDGKKVKGIAINQEVKGAYVYNNMIVVGDGDEKDVLGISVKNFTGIIANNSVMLTSYNHELFSKACGIYVEGEPARLIIANNLLDVIKTQPNLNKITGICNINAGLPKAMLNNFFNYGLGTFYYDKVSQKRYTDIDKVNSELGDNSKRNKVGLSPFSEYDDNVGTGNLHILFPVWNSSSYGGAGAGTKTIPSTPISESGNLETIFKDDFDGDIRGEKWDIGADEWQRGE